jgi:hypothetical protein
MNAESGSRTAKDREARAWLLDCEGMRVEGPDGLVGFVVAPLYEFSARWDRPWGLSVRNDGGASIIRMDAIETVVPEERRIVVRTAPPERPDIPRAV